uniref:DDHD domain-containing protein n=1 Tax=Macrostomum lignano TaxID=282301 RepID=A0A1I8H412_9PLAT
SMYQPVEPHWFHQHRVDASLRVWLPFSLYDSCQLEEAATAQTANIVAVNGGRFDANLSGRYMRPVYWGDEEVGNAESSLMQIRRCTWFYRPDGEDADTTFIPFDEASSDSLETHYRDAVLNNAWRKYFRLDGVETDGTKFVFHSPNALIQFSDDSEHGSAGASGVASGGGLPRVVYRGMGQFPGTLPPDSESRNPVDHVLFVVHGIGSVYDLLGHNLVQCVDRMRFVSGELMRSHFANQFGRVEFLPVHWHSALHSNHTTGLDAQLQRISLQSIPKLRRFANDTLTDVLFYSSPRYMQTIVDTVGKEMNRLRRLFLTRNPDYKGSFSLVGHSLGSVIAFDILTHQGLAAPAGSAAAAASLLSDFKADSGTNTDAEIDSFLKQCGLGESATVREKLKTAGVDSVDVLTSLTDAELKELGVPLGPRKKLLAAISKSSATKSKAKVQIPGEQQREPTPPPASKPVKQLTYVIGQVAGIGENTESQHNEGSGFPCVSYPQLEFSPASLFCLGSPIALFLTSRGVSALPAEYQLPECGSGLCRPALFNIFHPFDPIAYRLEPLLSRYPAEPFLIPHHKGRKRMHLQLRDSLTRVGTGLRHRLVSGLRATWSGLQSFAAAHSQQQRQRQQSTEEDDPSEDSSAASVDSSLDGSVEDSCDSALNSGRRLDYVLQEAPIEAFNDYLFALTSHACYWASEDTVLLMLTEVHRPLGVVPVAPSCRPRRCTLRRTRCCTLHRPRRCTLCRSRHCILRRRFRRCTLR